MSHLSQRFVRKPFQSSPVRSGFLLAAVALGLSACGGGGDSSAGAGGGGGGGGGIVATYGNISLPGRMIVNKGARVGTASRTGAFNLTTAQRTVLPSSPSPDADRWSTGAATGLALRYLSGASASTVTIFNATTLAVVRTVTIPAAIGKPQISADGQFLLAFVGSTLTVFDATDGQEVESVSAFNGFSVIGTPAAWMPDGRYVFLVGKTLAVTAPNAPTVDTVATLAGLPGATPSSVTNVDLAVSPDGRRIALSWNDGGDIDLWVVNAADGTGLKQLTRSAAGDALDYVHASPTWSPNSQWVAGVLYMSGTSSSPVYPDEPFLGSRITGSSGCEDQVFVVDPAGPTVQLDWPSFDATHGLKVIAASGTGGEWLATCSASISWMP